MTMRRFEFSDVAFCGFVLRFSMFFFGDLSAEFVGTEYKLDKLLVALTGIFATIFLPIEENYV
jgi:hypothetical protein